MNAREIFDSLVVMHKVNKPVFIWGPPGVGKSDTICQVADYLYNDSVILYDKRPRPYFLDIRAMLYDAGELKGIFVVINGKLVEMTPDMWPKDGAGIIVLDEMNAATPMVQGGLQQLTQDGRIGQYVKPPEWRVWAAGNDVTHRAAGQRLISSQANRFTHLDFDPDAESWCTWAYSYGIRADIIATIRFQPELLFMFNPQSCDKAWASSRTWHRASDILNANPPASVMYQLVAGTVGTVGATAYMTVRDVYMQLPDFDQVIASPDTAKVPLDNRSALFATCVGIAKKASRNTMDAIVKYGQRLPHEFRTLLVLDSVRQNPKVKQTQAYISWAAEHANLTT
jgi:hypothetical protein